MSRFLMQKRFFYGLIIIAFVVVLPLRLSADCLGMYAYSDVWADENGNILSVNQTSLDSSCVDYAAFADIGISLPGDYTHYESATGGVNAEALTYGPMVQAGEDGVIEGANGALSACGSHIFGLVDIRIGSAITKANWTGVKVGAACSAAPACSNTTNPMCYPFAMIGGVDQPCAIAWSIQYLTYSINGGPWQCFQVWANPVHFTAPAFCTPRV